MTKETFKEKQARILNIMATKEILDETKKLKDFLMHPEMVGRVNLNEVKRLSAKLAGKVVNINPDPGTEIERFLFAFKGKFHLITAGQYRKIEDAEVRTQLDEHSDMKIFYLCTNESMCPLPPGLIGREGTTGVALKDDQAVIDYIKRVSGVELKKTDL